MDLLERSGSDFWSGARIFMAQQPHGSLLFEVRLGGNHLLVKDAHDLNAVGFQNEKHDVLANLKATQAWTD